jgi:hypothetical protein
LWIFVLTAVAVAATACRNGMKQEASPQLGNGHRGGGYRKVVAPDAADNSRCHVCHINYDEEELALNHELGGVSCENCHGASDAHCSDENNITPPDIMYSKASVNPSCMKCHPKDAIKEVDHHKPLLSGTANKTKYCTNCHARDHRIPVRIVRWDKTTGKLLGAEE